MDRITAAARTPSLPHSGWVAAEPVVDGHRTKLPASALRPEELLPNTDTNTDTGLSRTHATVVPARRTGG